MLDDSLHCNVLRKDASPLALLPAAVPASVRAGAIVRCHALLPSTRASGRIEQFLFDAIARHASAPVAERVRAAGVERLHEHVDARQVVEIADALFESLAPYTREWMAEWLARLGHRSTFWFDPRPKVRLHVPHAASRAERALFAAYAKRRGDGKLTPHSPHLDSWHGCPTNAVNLWLSVGRSRPDNGMTIYPELFGRAIRPRGNEVSPDQYYGRGIDTDLARGDAWIFAGDHLHTSVLNHGIETRVCVSYRFTFDRPRVPEGEYERFVSSRWYQTGLEAATTSANALLARARLRLARRLQTVLAVLRPRVDAPLQPACPEPLTPGREQDLVLDLTSRALAPGQVRPLHAGAIAWRGASGRVHAGVRRCPHQGADLAAAEVCGERVLCPWHRLSLGEQEPSDPEAPRMRLLRSEERDGRILISRE